MVHKVMAMTFEILLCSMYTDCIISVRRWPFQIVQGVGIRLLLQKSSDIKILQLSAVILILAYILLVGV